MSNQSIGDLQSENDDTFSVIERLADAIRIEDDDRIGAEDRQRLVRDLYEGSRRCQCCINWVNEMPPDVEVETLTTDESTHPLIVRRRVRPTEGKTRLQIYSIEVCNPDVRKVLFDVFKGYDGLVPMIKYMIFKAPFRQFFWRWDHFEKAIEEEKDEVVKAVLIQLRSIVRESLAEEFAAHKELTSHGIITFKHIWTIFPPGELVYEDDLDTEYGQYYIVQSSVPSAYEPLHYQLTCYSVDWNGTNFGYQPHIRGVSKFTGTRRICDLPVVPAKYVRDEEEIRAKCIERGRKFYDLAGIHYKAYRNDNDENDSIDSPKKPEQRIVIDAKGHPKSPGTDLVPLPSLRFRPLITNLILQEPVGGGPPGGHVPLPTEDDLKYGRRPGHGPNFSLPPGADEWNSGMRPPRPGPPPPPGMGGMPRPPGPPGPSQPPSTVLGWMAGKKSMKSKKGINDSDSDSDSDEEEERLVLTEEQLQLCGSQVYGYDLREKDYDVYDVDRIVDINFNTKPFDSLVLPEGYKDLILSFVESQLKDGDTFDDVINGKGGGLVILLAGEPGVGKTMTAESVAEKINAPLVKMELAQLTKVIAKQCRTCKNNRDDSDSEDDDELSETFSQAAKWNAVLLIDECDMYLEKRNDDAPQRNHLISRFLRELEYYPSLLFLTTNRERVLDPAIYSRIHLTINYPALDKASRLSIWKTFIGREERSTVTEEELDILSDIDLNGRRIKNITKTARMMAKRGGRGISFSDIKNVMRITEGLAV
ncbi:hypothetical protein OQA88_4286 [Cercophora sp. LCS_1]